MDSYEKILVAFLATALAILLIMAIIILVKVIKLVNRVNRISEKVEALSNKANSLGDIFGRFAGPLTIAKFMAGRFKSSKKSRKG